MGNNESQSIAENRSVEADLSLTKALTTKAIVSASSNNEPKPEMFKLNVDCFELIFEWLTLQELLVFRCTCKRMKAVIDYYIKLNYPRVMCNRKDLSKYSPVRLGCFEWIKHLKLTGKVTDAYIDSIKYVLNQLESLSLVIVRINGDLYEKLLKYCSRLKYLSVETMTIPIIGTGNEWLERRYPTLEHFKIEFVGVLYREPPSPCAELLTFFQQNPNVRMFSSNCLLLLTYRDLFLGSNIKLDCLFIDICVHLDVICNATCMSKDSMKNCIYSSGLNRAI